MSDELKNYFAEISPTTPCRFIPHGIDTDFFKPENLSIKTNDILIVGNWMRDYKFADAVFDIVSKDNPNIKISVVALESNLNLLTERPQLVKHSSISDNSLKELYISSKILFLPLKEYTANNALLEAASCNCQILIATNQIRSDYLSNSLVDILPLDIVKVSNKISAMFNSKCIPQTQLHDYIYENFRWEKIGCLTDKFLSEFDKKKGFPLY
jgi:glycosyltransferase involved in cell wall biosynthesis